MELRNLQAVPFTDVRLEDDFWRPRIRTHSARTLSDDLALCEQTGGIDNFRKAAGKMPGGFAGIYFNDSDVYKVLEGIAYSLQTVPNPALEAKADAVIDLIADAQRPDGYLDTYFELPPRLDGRWTDMEKHEDYCAGHLIEAAVAYFQATGKKKLLDVARRVADHIDRTFRVPRRPWVSGHEEIELALIRLYKLTGERRYFSLAEYYLEQRGRGFGRGAIWDEKGPGPRYCQDDRPVSELREVSGHAVRAMFLYTAMADYTAESGSGRCLPALDSLWESVVRRNMYVTGGIGSSKDNEGFTKDYDLPNAEAYCETCASFGMVLWSSRMNRMKGQAGYADVMERAMYNGLLAGISLNGELYFYVNPLSSAGGHHRQKWYDCSCCPTQIARFLPSAGGYFYAADPRRRAVYVNLFARSAADVRLPDGAVRLRQQTDYPWDGRVTLTVEQAAAPFTLRLRLPGWCPSFGLLRGGRPAGAELRDGYLTVPDARQGDQFEYRMDMPVRRVHADSRVAADRGKVCLARGPLIYCVEEADAAPGEPFSLNPDDRFECRFEPDLLGGIVGIGVYGETGKPRFRAVPYYAWDNRRPGRMEVWLDEPPARRTELYR